MKKELEHKKELPDTSVNNFLLNQFSRRCFYFNCFPQTYITCSTSLDQNQQIRYTNDLYLYIYLLVHP